jgi:hypothetical protein
MAEDLKRVKEFWQAYRAAVLWQGVTQAKAEWFVRWPQPWPLHTHTPETARALSRRQAFRDEL